MKKLKTLCVALGLLLCSSLVSAQDSKLSIGLRGGVNLSNMDVDHIDTDMRVGYNFGVVAEYALPQSFFLQSGLHLTSKGSKVKYTEYDGDYYKAKLSINAVYLQLPIMAGYKLDVTDDFKVNFTVGPYLALGIGGKTKADVTIKDEFGSDKVNSFGNDILHRFDMGIGAGVGAEYKKVLFNVGYEYGFINAFYGDLKSYNRNAFISVGYRIF